MIVFATTIGATGLYLLFIWLISAAAGSWLSDRKGYGERVGLTFGLLLSAIGLLIVLLLAVATALLIRNMNSRLKRLPKSFDPPTPPDETDGPASGPTAGA